MPLISGNFKILPVSNFKLPLFYYFNASFSTKSNGKALQQHLISCWDTTLLTFPQPQRRSCDLASNYTWLTDFRNLHGSWSTKKKVKLFFSYIFVLHKSQIMEVPFIRFCFAQKNKWWRQADSRCRCFWQSPQGLPVAGKMSRLWGPKTGMYVEVHMHIHTNIERDIVCTVCKRKSTCLVRCKLNKCHNGWVVTHQFGSWFHIP